MFVSFTNFHNFLSELIRQPLCCAIQYRLFCPWLQMLVLESPGLYFQCSNSLQIYTALLLLCVYVQQSMLPDSQGEFNFEYCSERSEIKKFLLRILVTQFKKSQICPSHWNCKFSRKVGKS